MWPSEQCVAPDSSIPLHESKKRRTELPQVYVGEELRFTISRTDEDTKTGRHQITRHPIARLPPELLSLMFELGSEANPSTFPTSISQVNRTWRSIALQNSSLWTFIDFSDLPPYRRTALWLSRSRKAALSVVLSLNASERGYTGFQLDADELDQALSLIIAESYRWGSLVVHLDPELLRVVLERCSEIASAPRLRTLSIGCTEGDAIDEQFTIFGHSTTSLRRLHLACVPVSWAGEFFNSLTHLYLGYYLEEFAPSLEQFALILQRCSFLEELELDETQITTSQGSLEFSGYPILLPRLTFIRWASLAVEMYAFLCRCISAPAAHTYVGYGGHHDPEFQETVEELTMRNPFPGLRKLKLEYSKLCGPVIRRMLSVLEEMEELELFQCQQVGDETLEALIWKSDGARRYCPKLKKITLGLCEGFSIETLKLVVLSRCGKEINSGLAAKDPVKLESLVLLGCNGMEGSDRNLEWLRARVKNVEWVDPTPVPYY